MSGFSAEWLGLREAADSRARDESLVERLSRGFANIVDLGSGTGANLRWLAPRLGEGQQWTLIDHDPALLAVVNVPVIAGPGFSARIRTRQLDLDRELDSLVLPDSCLVTASALLDLVGRDWLERLVRRLAASRAAALFALSYDGSITIEPAHEEDRRIVELVNRHQRTDKGFGLALGPEAWRVAADGLEQAGFEVATAASPWMLGAGDGSLLMPLITGWTEAAIEIGGDGDTPAIERWCRERLRAVERDALDVRVGHRDLVALPR